MGEAKKVRQAQAAVRRFVNNVPGSAERKNADPIGDADVPYEGGTRSVEIKRATKGGQVYQVRAIRFIPCVVLDPRDDDWYVLPAGRLVREMAEYERGMHTQLSFECRQLTLSKAFRDKFSAWRCSDASLAEFVHRALVEDSAASGLAELMRELAGKLTKLQEEYIASVRAV